MDRRIDVTATGTLSLEPDAVSVRFSVEEFGEAYKDVELSLNKRVSEFRDLVEGIGFDRKDLISQHYEIKQHYEYDDNSNRFPTGFLGEHRLSFKFELDQKRLDRLLRTLHPVLLGIPYKVSFGLMNPEARKNEVINIAVKKAISEAKQLTKSAGVNLGPIVKMNYGDRHYPSMAVYESNTYREPIDEEDDYVNPGFEPGELSLSQSVYMEWELVSAE